MQQLIPVGTDAAGESMDGWDLALLLVVSYLAVMALVRLMLFRRDRLIKDMSARLDDQLRRRNQ